MRPTGPAVLAAFLIVALAVGASPVVAAGSTPPATVDGDVPSTTAAVQSFARSTVEIRVFENGSARWTFRYVRPLANESEVEDFRAYADRFNGEETDLYRGFVADSRAVVGRGENATGREMRAVGFARHAEVRRSLGNDLGVVAMSFTWRGFARTDGDRVLVGDVFEGGLYLGPDQTLVFHPGPGLRFVEVRPEATWSNASSLAGSDSVTWTGERQFTDNRPDVVLAPPRTGGTDGGGTGTPTAATSPPSSTSPPPAGGGLPGGLFAVGVLTVLVVVGAAWVVRGGNDDGDVDGNVEGPVAGDPTAGERTEPDATEPEADDEEDESATGAESSGSESAQGLSDDALLSDEGRVVALLADHDGRMKQTRIVEETGWSKSKVSMLLSEMADEGRVEKLRIGRENVITLTEDDADPSSGE